MRLSKVPAGDVLEGVPNIVIMCLATTLVVGPITYLLFNWGRDHRHEDPTVPSPCDYQDANERIDNNRVRVNDVRASSPGNLDILGKAILTALLIVEAKMQELEEKAVDDIVIGIMMSIENREGAIGENAKTLSSMYERKAQRQYEYSGA